MYDQYAGISVIIPYYNAIGTINNCLNSLITKAIDVEVIIVDDNSTRGCEDVVGKYTKDGLLNIKFFKNEMNIGAGRTRNRGLQEAAKEYVTFLDSDDEFAPEYFDSIKKSVEKQYDVIIYDTKRVFENTSYEMKMFFSNRIHSGEITTNNALVFIKGCTCGKIYKTDLIRKQKIEFGETRINEDLVFTKVAISYAKRIFYIEKPLYIYNDSVNSLTNSESRNTDLDEWISFNLISGKINQYYVEEINSIYFLEVLYAIPNTMLGKGESILAIKKTYNELTKDYCLKDKYRNKYDFKYRFAVSMYNLGLFKLYWNIRTKIIKLYTS